jgi:hypothetical protein
MPRCIGHKPDGGRCGRIVGAEHSYCYSHDPGRADERSRNAAAGGRGKASKEVRDLKAEIKAVIADVKSGALDRNDAAAMISGYRALRDYLELERRIAEQDELLARLVALEEAQASPGGGTGRAWGR